MSESDELYLTVNYIKNKVDALEKIELLNLRSNKALLEEYISILQADSLLNKVYKEIDGQKSQREIAGIVNTTEMTVSNKIKKLLECGLIEIKEVGENGKKIYKHSIAEQAFKLTRI
ncbi:MAG: winged helix-turn-helix transcriptional regulator [Clostridiales bacterium]|nr:winged helix-turn-helix transcriptional regulator [Candidatus Cacconaster stercorequi]